METFSSFPVALINDGRGSTFRRAGTSSIIDLSSVSDGLISRTTWKLTENFTNNDHQAIGMKVAGRNTRRDGLPKFTDPKWKDFHFDEKTYGLMLSSFHTTGSTVKKLVGYTEYLTLHVMLLCLGEPYVGDVPSAIGGMTRFEIYGRHALGRGEEPSDREEDRHGRPNGLHMRT